MPTNEIKESDIGTLYVVATPIGNWEDITLRALRVLSEVGLVAAEDTRTAQQLLDHYDIQKPITSYYEHNAALKLDRILEALQQQDVALISEAGMPGLSDPGYRLINAAIEAELPVVPVPGATAAITALVVSGLPTDSFVYLGFLPRKAAARRQALRPWRQERRTLIAYEAPHRLVACLADIQRELGDRPLAVAREMTKTYEETLRGTASEIMAHFQQAPPRGEITLVIGGAGAMEQAPWPADRVIDRLETLLQDGLPKTDASKLVAEEAHWPRRKVYKLAIDLPRAD